MIIKQIQCCYWNDFNQVLRLIENVNQIFALCVGIGNNVWYSCSLDVDVSSTPSDRQILRHSNSLNEIQLISTFILCTNWIVGEQFNSNTHWKKKFVEILWIRILFLKNQLKYRSLNISQTNLKKNCWINFYIDF